jgi:uncharacterized peroxidase-related enzyme
MSRFPSVPEDPHLGQVFHRFPKGVMSLCRFHDEILREESDLTIGEREMIAAVTSATNACNFCFDAHRRAAEIFYVDVDLVDHVVSDFDNAPLDPKLRPLLAYIIKLTRAPAQVTDLDAQAVYAAGWSESALMDAVMVCGLFNLMNRIVEGTGVVPRKNPPQWTDDMKSALRERTYTEFAEAAISGKLG